LADDSDGSEDKSAELPIWSFTKNFDAGGAYDLWGGTLSIADVEDVDFGFFVGLGGDAGGTNTAIVDSMQMRIHYTMPYEDSGWLVYGTFDGDFSSGSGVTWSNPSNLSAENGSDATYSKFGTPGASSNVLSAQDITGIAAAIPPGSTIHGIAVKFVEYTGSALPGDL